MCGIFTLLNNISTYREDKIKEAFQKGVGRGPEYSELMNVTNNDEKLMFGFHRLAINGLNEISNQPLRIDNIVLICNGEIYNYKELYKMLEIEPTTSSDCEVIIHLYKRYGIEYTLQVLDGVFSFALYEKASASEAGRASEAGASASGKESVLHIARDPYGVRPLYMLNCEPFGGLENTGSNNNTIEPIIAFASEIKVLNNLFNAPNYEEGTNERLQFSDYHALEKCEGEKLLTSSQMSFPYKITHFEPGTYRSFTLNKKFWKPMALAGGGGESHRYHTFNFNPALLDKKFDLIDYNMTEEICYFLNKAVEKRVVGTTERPVACLLSGGLDSSLIAALVSKYYTENGKNGKVLETYSIGMEGSEDLKYAQIVANHIGSKHTSIIVTEDDFFNAIPEVIKAIESYDTTTVRASVGNYLLGKYIKANSEAKVIFNGDGSDELTGGYLYFQEAPNGMEFDKECKRLLKDIHAFDVLRSDKCISSHGLEPRTPFLDRSWVDYYLSIPISYRNHGYKKDKKLIEKYLLRYAFDINEPNLLPSIVLWRKKEAFSDGVSGVHKSWFEIIKERLAGYNDGSGCDDDDVRNNKYQRHNIPKTNEQRYYRNIYDKAYPNTANVVPYFWMPRFIENVTDASARTLSIYQQKK
jgi:asparagine synthase (glutamine-hydrolysing)